MEFKKLEQKINKHLRQLQKLTGSLHREQLQAVRLILKHCLEQLKQHHLSQERRLLERQITAGIGKVLEDYDASVLLLKAIEENDNNLLEALIAFHPKIVTQSFVEKGSMLKTKTNALIMAAAKGHIEAVKLLIGVKGLDINFGSGTRRTALDEAIRLGNFEMVKLLLNAGAKPTQISFQFACSKGYLQIAKELVEANKEQPPFDYNQALMQTITQGKGEIIYYLVGELEADVNFVQPPIFKANASSLTPLILAIQYQQSAAASFLIGMGAKASGAKAHFAMTDLAFAAFIGDADRVTKILAVNLVELNKRDKEGYTPLMRAVQSGNPNVVQQLMDAGANIHAELENGYTARALAALNKDEAIIQAIDHFTSKGKARDDIENILVEYLDNRTKQVDEQGNTKEYLRDYLPGFFQKSYSAKKDAVNALHQALKGEQVDLAAHLSTLRNGNLGQQLREFIRSGQADCLVGCKVETVSSFVAALQNKVNEQHPASPAMS